MTVLSMSLFNTIIFHLFSEYSSQLPADGGAFYTADTMDMSRPHYKKAWPPILYAASLWLKETGFTNVDKDGSRPANMKADESDADRFHLLLGQYPNISSIQRDSESFSRFINYRQKQRAVVSKNLQLKTCLFAGICVEALCSPTSTQNIETVNLCLKSVYTLLDDPWPRNRIGLDHSLGIELLNVMHR